MRLRPLLAFALSGLFTAVNAADPGAAFRPWSAFDRIDLRALATGTAVTACNTGMKAPRGISAQAAFLVAVPVEKTMNTLLTADPTKRPELEVYENHFFRDETDAAFEKLKLDPSIAPVRRLLEAMSKRNALQLSPGEEARLPAARTSEARLFWISVLRERWKSVAERGDLGLVSGYRTRDEIRGLLAEEPAIAEHFRGLLAPFTARSVADQPARYYWDVANVNHVATIELGVVYTRSDEGREQLLDVAFYASSGFLASVTLYECVPLIMDGRSVSLVWQGCLVSATELAGGFGIKRKLASKFMLRDLEQSVHALQSDATSSASGDRR